MFEVKEEAREGIVVVNTVANTINRVLVFSVVLRYRTEDMYHGVLNGVSNCKAASKRNGQSQAAVGVLVVVIVVSKVGSNACI